MVALACAAIDTPRVEALEVRYAKSGDANIAYSVVGEGPFDLVFIGGSVYSTLEYAWEGPPADFYRRLAAFSRLILFDKRGTGLSDRDVGVSDLATRMDDLRAVMDAASSRRAAVMGVSEGGPITLLFAATSPDRIAAAVLFGTGASFARSEDYPWAPSRDERVEGAERRERMWAMQDYIDRLLVEFAPDLAKDESVRRWWRRYARTSASPSAAAALSRMNLDVDVRHVLPAVRVPTLILHRIDDKHFHLGEARYMAERIEGAQLVELPGHDHLYFSDPDQIVREVEPFLHGIWERGDWDEVEADRVLTTILFTDIVGSTAKAAELGDRRWRELLGEHHTRVRRQLVRFRGREIDTAGDGFFASFDGPARAIHAACEIVDSVGELQLEVRAGIHTGECERVDDKVGGIAVHIGARVAAEARPGEVLVSSTVRDLVAGSGIGFRERGGAELKGLPGEWRLFAVERA